MNHNLALQIKECLTEQTIKSCLVFHSPQECWGGNSTLQVITEAKMLLLTSLSCSSFGYWTAVDPILRKLNFPVDCMAAYSGL